ncbi:MAG TPA: DUF1844 domain-containing protein [Verrucomicrobiae bacterium]|nr:DUF1844 domain-containing protein [Verrucomicrobiae bacterium]
MTGQDDRRQTATVCPTSLGRSGIDKMFLMADEAPDTQEQQIPLPPPSFSFIVLSLRAQAEMQLGLMRFSEEDNADPDLVMARHTIDLMAVLLEKTKGNLSLEEQRLLENSVTELRFRFVQISDEASRATEQKA